MAPTTRTPRQPTKTHPGLLAKLKSHLFPTIPDFYGLLIDQCRVTAEGTGRLVQFFQDRDPALGLEVRHLEHEGDRIKARNIETLHRAFATPMDREDFYDAVMAIDEILNYAKTSVREVDILDIEPDPHLIEMAKLVHDGAMALLEGCRHLEREPVKAAVHAGHARKTERDSEKVYRRALADLLDADHQLARLTPPAPPRDDWPDATDVLRLVTRLFKQREIYRHLSNAADHVAQAARVLEDIVAKAT